MGAHGEPLPAPEQYHDFIAKLLVDYGADIKAKDNSRLA